MLRPRPGDRVRRDQRFTTASPATPSRCKSGSRELAARGRSPSSGGGKASTGGRSGPRRRKFAGIRNGSTRRRQAAQPSRYAAGSAVDFWTYSCVNCLRTLPHVRPGAGRIGTTAWSSSACTRRSSPSSTSRLNVRRQCASSTSLPRRTRQHVRNVERVPNAYWPAKYLVDRTGHIRYFHAGEGDYERDRGARSGATWVRRAGLHGLPTRRRPTR